MCKVMFQFRAWTRTHHIWHYMFAILDDNVKVVKFSALFVLIKFLKT